LVYNSTSRLLENGGHNDLAGKQGGDGTNFFHLGQSDYNNLNQVLNNINTEWVSASASEANFWVAVTYGNGLFVAVSYGGSGRVMTSPDGITWTTATIPVLNSSWRSVTYGNGLFVVVGDFGTTRVLTSSDGITWTGRSASVDIEWRGVTYGNGLFVAVAQTGTGASRVMTSPDGITWTTRSASSNDSWQAVTYGNGLFVAVANSRKVMSSPDGITWTDRTTPALDFAWSSIVFGNNLFVTIATSGNGRASYTTDGITWNTVTIPFGFYEGITYGNGLYVAVGQGQGADAYVLVSKNAIDWEIQTPADLSTLNSWECVTYGNGRFVAVSSNGSNRVMYSDFDKILNHSQLNFDDGLNPHGTRYEDLLGTPPSIAPQISSATEKTTVADNDLFALVDSAASNVLKKLKWSSIKTVLQTFLDTLYAPITRSLIEQVDYVDAWYTHPITSTGSKQLNDGEQFYVPINHMIYAKSNMKMTAIAFRTSAAPGATSLIRVAIYERTTANNLSLVTDFGNTSMDVIGTITFTFATPATLSKGKLYYVVFKKDNSGTSGATFQGVTTSPEHTQFLFAPSPVNMFQTNHALYKTSISTGAFPSTDTLPTESSDQIIPRFQFRLETL
jgi:hypothetical protein